jgi:hypothetical protein
MLENGLVVCWYCNETPDNPLMITESTGRTCDSGERPHPNPRSNRQRRGPSRRPVGLGRGS